MTPRVGALGTGLKEQDFVFVGPRHQVPGYRREDGTVRRAGGQCSALWYGDMSEKEVGEACTHGSGSSLHDGPARASPHRSWQLSAAGPRPWQ